MWDIENQHLPKSRAHIIVTSKGATICQIVPLSNCTIAEIGITDRVSGIIANTEIAESNLDFDLAHPLNNPTQNTYVIDVTGENFTSVIAIEFNGLTYQQAELADKLRPLEFCYLQDQQRIVICIPRY